MKAREKCSQHVEAREECCWRVEAREEVRQRVEVCGKRKALTQNLWAAREGA